MMRRRRGLYGNLNVLGTNDLRPEISSRVHGVNAPRLTISTRGGAPHEDRLLIRGQTGIPPEESPSPSSLGD